MDKLFNLKQLLEEIKNSKANYQRLGEDKQKEERLEFSRKLYNILTGKNVSSEEFKDSMESAFKEFQRKMKDYSSDVSSKEQDEDSDDNCDCGHCLGFDNFERVLGGRGKPIQYQTVKFGDIEVDLKYHVDGDGTDRLVFQRKKVNIDPNKSTEELRKLLNEAISKEDFVTAQSILSLIHSKKNSN